MRSSRADGEPVGARVTRPCDDHTLCSVVTTTGRARRARTTGRASAATTGECRCTTSGRRSTPGGPAATAIGDRPAPGTAQQVDGHVERRQLLDQVVLPREDVRHLVQHGLAGRGRHRHHEPLRAPGPNPLSTWSTRSTPAAAGSGGAIGDTMARGPTATGATTFGPVGVDVRVATPADERAVVDLLDRAMGRPSDDRTLALDRWKHDENRVRTVAPLGRRGRR